MALRDAARRRTGDVGVVAVTLALAQLRHDVDGGKIRNVLAFGAVGANAGDLGAPRGSVEDPGSLASAAHHALVAVLTHSTPSPVQHATAT